MLPVCIRLMALWIVRWSIVKSLLANLSLLPRTSLNPKLLPSFLNPGSGLLIRRFPDERFDLEVVREWLYEGTVKFPWGWEVGRRR